METEESLTINGLMKLFNLTDLIPLLTREQRLLGIDPGERTIGLALSDVSRFIATPYGSLRRAKLGVNANEIIALARKEDVGGLIVGLPLSMDGSFGPKAQAARDWARSLAEMTGLPAAMCDERLSSAAMNRFLIGEADLSRGKRAEAIDRAAAAYMLQGALDMLRLALAGH